jgi:cytochrome c-type biogenesis protein CcmH
LLATLLLSVVAHAAAPPDDELERRTAAVARELRCLVCQNQTIEDSQAELAVDLRNQVREMLRQGSSDADVVRFMTERYGDFVVYRPPLDTRTGLLWFGPAALLVVGLALLLRRILRHGARTAPPLRQDQLDDAGRLLARGREDR